MQGEGEIEREIRARLEAQLDQIDQLNAQCRTAIHQGDSQRGFELLGQSLDLMMRVLGIVKTELPE